MTPTRLQNGSEAAEGRLRIAQASHKTCHRRCNASVVRSGLFKNLPPTGKFGALALMLLGCIRARVFGACELVASRPSGLNGDAKRSGVFLVVGNEGGKAYGLGD